MNNFNSLLVAALLSVPASASEAEPAQKPELRTVEIEGRSPEALAKVFAGLKEEKVQGLPPGWDSPEELAKAPFINALGANEKDDLHAIVEGGVFRGLSFKRGDRSFLYMPPQLFAVEMGKAGQAATTALVIKDGVVEERPLDSLGGSATTASAAARDLSGRSMLRGALSDGGAAFDGGQGRGAAPLSGAYRTIWSAGAGGKAPMSSRFLPDNAPLAIANSYKDAPPPKVKKGQLYWDGKTLKAAEAAAEGEAVKGRPVGYMADVKDDTQGDVLFWHGGAEPGADGRHPAWNKHWSLYYLPKVEAGVEVVGEKTTARYVSKYARMDLSKAKTLATEEGERLDLSTALSTRRVVLRLPPEDVSKRNSMHEPQERALFSFSVPVAGGGRPTRGFVDLAGNTYDVQASGGKRYIVHTGKLFRVKEPASATDVPPAGLSPAAPAERREEPRPVAYGPAEPPLPVPAERTPLAEALASPEAAPGRAAEVERLAVEFAAENQLTLEAERRRNELELLLADPAPATRADTVHAMLLLDPARPNPKALGAVRWFMDPAARTVDPAVRVRALTALKLVDPASRPAELAPGLFPDLVRTIIAAHEPPAVRNQALQAYYALQPDEASRESVMRSFQAELKQILEATAAENLRFLSNARMR